MLPSATEVRLVRNLHSGQRAIWAALLAARFAVLVAGRRWGKGELAAERIRQAALERPGDYAFVAPTYKQGKNIIWGKLRRRFPAAICARAPNETTLTIQAVNGSRIVVLGADKPDSLRGWDQGFRGAVLDEYDQFKPHAFEEVIRPMLADWRGWAMFTGTPAGFANLYELWKRGHDPAFPEWVAWRTFTSHENPWLDPDEIEEARRTSDPRLFRQEWEASFEAPAGRIYDDFSREANVRPCPFDAGLALYAGLDFNLDPMSCVLVQQHGPELWVVREVEQHHSHTQRLGQFLRQEYQGRSLEVWCDPSGNAGQHNIGTSDVRVLQSLGFVTRFRHVHRESDKFNAVRQFILNAAGQRRLFIDPSCKRLIERLEQLGPDDEDDHLTDALAYLIYGKFAR